MSRTIEARRGDAPEVQAWRASLAEKPPEQLVQYAAKLRNRIETTRRMTWQLMGLTVGPVAAGFLYYGVVYREPLIIIAAGVAAGIIYLNSEGTAGLLNRPNIIRLRVIDQVLSSRQNST